MPLITINQMQKYYGDNHVLKGVDLDIDMGEVISIIGRSGSGKSTLLRCINGLEGYQEGSIKLGGMTITDRDSQAREISRSIGMVFQKPNPFPMSIYDNIAYGPRVHGIKSKAKLDRIVEESLIGAAVFDEVKDRLHKSALSLSGGQQQRVAIARALIKEPDILLLDEPTNHLDIDSKEVLENALIDFDGTLLFVSHDRYFINRVATKVMEISEDGAAIYLGDYDYYLEKKAELEELARLEAEENQVSEEVQVASAGASDYQAQKANQKEMRKLSRRIEQIENELETIEERLEEISAAMLETNDVAELSDLQKELDDLTDSQEALMEEWSDLSEQMEG